VGETKSKSTPKGLSPLGFGGRVFPFALRRGDGFFVSFLVEAWSGGVEACVGRGGFFWGGFFLVGWGGGAGGAGVGWRALGEGGGA